MQVFCVNVNNNAKGNTYSPYVVMLVGLVGLGLLGLLVVALIGLFLVAVIKRI